ncbi:2Fe-2S iron-sulfur cluster binding domain-containing protein [Cohnella sp. CFH 77786]|uniref:2Fe-2S iron-sulfur cluster-binding protein n=1 Tax=Cohnella sp. CFH 77786 TaxID=2662265 RepID=UPI001C610660|nr:2Fe-2S iron-sulfur cluster-binding protein [Cohnella sp. CFH 77786]MBW5446653.1 2Fe-2S iron-sulfur cluster binding domain-containing protein [Cohnella sp. CFH 77786]
MLTLTGRTRTKTAEAEIGHTLLEHALKAGVDWNFNCSRGTCARCRCYVESGADLLAEPTDAEWDRLGPDELDGGFRLGCQAEVVRKGKLIAVNRTYF